MKKCLSLLLLMFPILFLGKISTTKENLADSFFNQARQLQEQGETTDAIETYKQALEKDPNHILALFNLATLYTAQENYDIAETYYRTILAINPNYLAVHYNLAYTLRLKGLWNDAIPHYQWVLEHRSDHHESQYGLAECLLGTRKWEKEDDAQKAWALFESRWQRGPDTRNFTTNVLTPNQDIHGKTILVRSEYGQGDTIQFIRFLPLLKEQGATIILEAQHTLIPLLSRCPYIDQLISVADPVAELPSFDMQIPLMSLPRIFNTTLTTIPTKPYMTADPNLVSYWQEKLASDNNFKIGICWEGSPYYESFKSTLSKRAIPLTIFIPLTKIEGVSVYSLQKMNGLEQLYSLPDAVNIHDFGQNFDNEHGRFMDTAAVIANLDLVISTDTSIAHLAGALGKPVWVLLPHVADWRWMTQCDDSPWYPTMRLFRQVTPGNWSATMRYIVEELNTLLTYKNQPTDKITAEISLGELIDKITILQIKCENIQDPEKLRNIYNELESLNATYNEYCAQSEDLTTLTSDLLCINKKLWEIEDAIREKERNQTFDREFIKLARSVYYSNDERCRIKRKINELLGSRLLEEKSYTDYQPE